MTEENIPLEYQVFALSFLQEGAIGYFNDHLPVSAVGGHGQFGLQQFYKTILDFYTKTSLDPIDPIAFKSWLETETDIYNALGGSEMVELFVNTVKSVEKSTPEAVTNLLKFRSNKREQLEYVQELQSILSKKGRLDSAASDRIAMLTEKIRYLETELDYNPLERVVTAQDIAMRGNLDSLWEIPEFLPTQFKDLNKAMGYTESGGFFKGAVHSIIGQSGTGKSTFAKTLCNHWLDQDKRVLFINYEEPQALWERTLFIQLTKKNIYKGGFSTKEKDEATKHFHQKMIQWGDRMMVRHDPDTPYFEDLESWLKDLIGHNDKMPDVVIIDTIQSLFTKGSKGVRWGQFEEIMVRLEKLARDMNAVFIITVQENANRMREGREVVKQSDTGGSLAIQQKSAVTIFLTKPKDKGEIIEETVMELQIPKNRITGTVFQMDPARVKYNDEIKAYESYDAHLGGYEKFVESGDVSY